MKRLTILAVALAFFAGCGDDPTSPSDLSPMFTAQLSPANEVPPIGNAEQSGSGNVTITLTNITRDAAGTITAATADFQVNLTGFPAGTTLTAAHIHNARAGSNGGTINNLGLTANEFVLANGSVSFTKTGIAFTPALIGQVQNMLVDPAGFYFNVHSTVNAGGVARGQLTRIQ
jgi:CHRD domain-containing protein